MRHRSWAAPVVLAAAWTFVSGCGGEPTRDDASSERIGAARQAVLVDSEDFESGSWSSFFAANWCTFSYSCKIVPSPDGLGQSFRAEYRTGDYDGTRETKGDELASPSINGAEQWIGLRIYFASDELGPDSKPVVLLQQHDVPDPGEQYRNPIMALTYADGVIGMDYKGSSDAITPQNPDGSFVYTDHGGFKLGPPILDTWNFFVIHIVWDPTGHNGMLEGWLNQAYQQLTGINIGFNDQERPRLKFGNYYYSGGQSDFPVRRTYFDDVRIFGGTDGSFCAVSPPGAPMPPDQDCNNAPPEQVDPGAQGPFSPSALDGCAALGPVAVRASSFQEPNYPSSTVDGNLATRWSAEGSSEWIEYELSDLKELDAFAVAVYQGDTRTQNLDVRVSTDRVGWTEVARVTSSGSSLELERWDLATGAPARWVRVVGRGNSINAWNSLTEVLLCGTDLPDPPPDGGSGGAGGGSALGGEGGGAGSAAGGVAAASEQSDSGCGCRQAPRTTGHVGTGLAGLLAPLALLGAWRRREGAATGRRQPSAVK